MEKVEYVIDAIEYYLNERKKMLYADGEYGKLLELNRFEQTFNIIIEDLEEI